MGEEMVFRIDGWLLLGAAISGAGISIVIIYRLLATLADMVIKGIKHEIVDCQEALLREIKEARGKAERAHAHAETAHKRIGRVENVLMQNGVNLLEKKP